MVQPPSQQQDVPQDQLCPPNKRFDLMDANKKLDPLNPHCPNESKILTNILLNHPLRLSIARSTSVPWIYMYQFWNTLQEDGSRMYAAIFWVDVPTTQSQQIESTQGTHRITSTPRTPNPEVVKGES
nr:hypothetical protein [Tanacetum cinerariifolium]